MLIAVSERFKDCVAFVGPAGPADEQSLRPVFAMRQDRQTQHLPLCCAGLGTVPGPPASSRFSTSIKAPSDKGCAARTSSNPTSGSGTSESAEIHCNPTARILFYFTESWQSPPSCGSCLCEVSHLASTGAEDEHAAIEEACKAFTRLAESNALSYSGPHHLAEQWPNQRQPLAGEACSMPEQARSQLRLLLV